MPSFVLFIDIHHLHLIDFLHGHKYSSEIQGHAISCGHKKQTYP